MKGLIMLAAALPGAALAHGDHAPAAGAAHGTIHAAPLVGVGVAAALILIWLGRTRS